MQPGLGTTVDMAAQEGARQLKAQGLAGQNQGSRTLWLRWGWRKEGEVRVMVLLLPFYKATRQPMSHKADFAIIAKFSKNLLHLQIIKKII